MRDLPGTGTGPLAGAVPGGLPTLLAHVDREGRNVFASPAASTWLGMSPEEATGRHVRELLGPEQWDLVGPRVELAQAGVHQQFERPLSLGGQEVWTLTEYLPRVVAGRPDGFYVLLRDHSRVARAEAQVRHAARLTDDVLQHLFAAGLAVRRLEQRQDPDLLAGLAARLQEATDALRLAVVSLAQARPDPDQATPRARTSDRGGGDLTP